ncbi:MAG: DUF4190 domain-containing protein [bacterium]
MPEATCPNCRRAFSHPDTMTRGTCPACQAVLRRVEGEWTVASEQAPAAHGPTCLCPSCGEANEASRSRCVYCDDLLHPEEMAPSPSGVDSAVETLIPYRNAHALAAYYLGVFALIPCAGLILGVLAVIFGVLGLRAARAHPETKGRGHAIAGLVLGVLVLLGHLAAFIAIAASANA